MMPQDGELDEPVMIAYGCCIRCDVPFGFDPERVPSVYVHPVTRCSLHPDGSDVHPNDPDVVREPVCPGCASLFRLAGGTPYPIVRLFPHARFDLIDRDNAMRIQAGRSGS